MNMQRILLAGALTSILTMCGCGGVGFDSRVHEDFHYSYPLQPGGTLEFSNFNGSVEVSGWDRNTIDVSGTKYAADPGTLNRIQTDVTASGDSARVITTLPDHHWFHSSSVKYVIHVPRQTAITNGRTTNGAVSLEDLSGGGHVTSSNGRLALNRDDGDYELRTTNGSISFQNCAGKERAESSNGGIRGDLKAGAFEVKSTNGTIDLRIAKPSDAQTISAVTTNGAVTITLPQFHNNPVSIHTSNGSATLRLPENTNAHVELRNSHGNIKDDLTLTGSVQWNKNDVSGNLGKGGPLLSVVTSNGSIHLERF